MTGLLSHIIMRTGLALSINSSAPTPGNVLILKDNDGADPDQFWSLLFWRPNAHILYNPHRNLYAAPRSLDNGAPVILFELPPSLQFADAHAWEIISGAPFVIRSAADEDLNLRAAGESWGPGTPMIVFKWDGGRPNEVWDISLREFGR